MWSYILRRLLLMIPTLFGVTVVSFLIMQLAPGDPLLSQIDSGGTAGQSSQTREAFLLQKRDLKLDKPILLNFRYFSDYSDAVGWAAYYESRAETEVLGKQPRILADLTELAAQPDGATARERLRFLRKLAIRDFDEQLADPEQRDRLASAVIAYVHNFCEDLGANGVPAAIAMLKSPEADTRRRIGIIRVLRRMVPDPFVSTYSRSPTDAQTPLVSLSWKVWWEREKSKFPPIDPDRREVLAKRLQALAAEASREKVFEELENFDRDDTAFFVERLLGDSPLAEKVICSHFLKLYNNEPLRADVAGDASEAEVDQVAENWLAHFEAHQADYEPSLPVRLWSIVGDTQYAHMVWRLVTFQFGRSALKTREPVSEKIWNAVVVSAPLMLMAELMIYLVAVPLGILCAVHRGKLLDRLISLGLFLLYSIPPFVAGMMFLLFLCYGDYLKWFPMERLHSEAAEGYGLVDYSLDYVWHAILPVLCLSLFSLASLAMYSRSAILDVISQDYVRTARAKGLSSAKVILKHVLRNGLIPIITLFSNSLPALLGGSVLVEFLFNIPGMGRLSFTSIDQKDFPTIMALVYIEAIVVLFSILLSDLLYVLVDPRISFEGQGQSA